MRFGSAGTTVILDDTFNVFYCSSDVTDFECRQFSVYREKDFTDLRKISQKEKNDTVQ